MSAGAERSFPFSALLPALWIGAFAVGFGTFSTALDAWRVVAGHILIVVFALVGCRAGLDPFRLAQGRGQGRAQRRAGVVGALGPMLVAAVWIGPAISAWLSPVPRAGIEGLLLLPALIFAVPAVVWLWRTPRRRRLGAAGLGVVLAVVAIIALVALWRAGGLRGDARAALPLGHHNLLALWLVMVLPVVAHGAGRGSILASSRSAQPTGLPKPTAVFTVPVLTILLTIVLTGAVLLGLVALIATRSLGGTLALGALAFAMAWHAGSRRGRCRCRCRWLAMIVVIAALGLMLPRLARVARGDDASTRVRMGYLEAATVGIKARPWTGWGPAGAHWTLAEHMRPVPGVHPAGEVVADPHSLPFRLAYDLGLPGLLLVVMLAFVLMRRRPTLDGRLGFASTLGLAAFVIAATFTRPLAAMAVPVTLAVLLGARLAATAAPRADGVWGRRIATFIVLISALALIPLDAARIAYDQAARSATQAGAERALAQAVALDPWHPLYRARLAAIRGDRMMANQAAQDARGVSALWLAAGAGPATEPASRKALARACVLDRLAPIPAFLLALSDAHGEHAAALGGRALLAEPRLLAAASWPPAADSLPGLRSRSIAWALARDGVDLGWLEGLRIQAPKSIPGGGSRQALVVRADTDSATALSLHVFQRRPWPWRLASVAIDVEALANVSLVPASVLPSTARRTFDPHACRAFGAW